MTFRFALINSFTFIPLRAFYSPAHTRKSYSWFHRIDEKREAIDQWRLLDLYSSHETTFSPDGPYVHKLCIGLSKSY